MKVMNYSEHLKEALEQARRNGRAEMLVLLHKYRREHAEHAVSLYGKGHDCECEM